MLRLNAPVSFGARQIAPLLSAFVRRYPDVKIDLGLNDRIVDLAEEGWDLAIRIRSLTNSSLIARRIAPCRTVVCAVPSYLQKHETPRRVTDLVSHNCLGCTLSRTVGAGRWAFGAKAEIDVEVSGDLRANNGDALRAVAIAGQGLIYQPTFIVADDIRAGTLRPIKLNYPTIEFGGIYAVFLPNRNPAAKVRVFIEFLIECLMSEPPWDRAVA